MAKDTPIPSRRSRRVADVHDTGRLDDDEEARPGPMDLEETEFETPAIAPNRRDTLTLDDEEITHEQ